MFFVEGALWGLLCASESAESLSFSGVRLRFIGKIGARFLRPKIVLRIPIREPLRKDAIVLGALLVVGQNVVGIRHGLEDIVVVVA